LAAFCAVHQFEHVRIHFQFTSILSIGFSVAIILWSRQIDDMQYLPRFYNRRGMVPALLIGWAMLILMSMSVICAAW